MSVHHDQVASVLRRAVQEILSRGLNDPRVRGLISVTKVKISDDLVHATIWVSILPAEHAELTMHGLRHATQFMRTELGRRVRLRRLPRLAFKLDQSLKKEAGVIAAINEAQRLDREHREPAPDNPSSEEAEP